MSEDHPDRAQQRSQGEAVDAPAVKPSREPIGLLRRTPGAWSLARPWSTRTGTVMLVLDHSTSMADPGKMHQLRRGAFKFFVEAVRRHYAVGAVAFASKTQLLSPPGVDIPRFWRRLQRLEPYGRTRMARPLKIAQRRLRFRRGHRVIVLLTDGMPDDADATLAAARFIRDAGITLIPIGTGQADEAFLRTLAGRPELAHVTGLDGFSDAVADVAGRLQGP